MKNLLIMTNFMLITLCLLFNCRHKRSCIMFCNIRITIAMAHNFRGMRKCRKSCSGYFTGLVKIDKAFCRISCARSAPHLPSPGLNQTAQGCTNRCSKQNGPTAVRCARPENQFAYCEHGQQQSHMKIDIGQRPFTGRPQQRQRTEGGGKKDAECRNGPGRLLRDRSL